MNGNGITAQDCEKMMFCSVVVVLIGVLIHQGAVAIVGLTGVLAGLALLWRME
jgi:hypothetical protein